MESRKYLGVAKISYNQGWLAANISQGLQSIELSQDILAVVQFIQPGLDQSYLRTVVDTFRWYAAELSSQLRKVENK